MNRLRRITALSALSLTAMSLTAHAQDAGAQQQPPADSTITVEGVLDPDGVDVRDQARDITNQRGSTTDPLARFNDALCPGVWGLSAENAQLVVDRIYDNAEQAGVQVNVTENCRANAWIIVVDDPHETFEQLRDDGAFLLNGITPPQRRRIQAQEGPVMAWNTVATRTNTGIAAGPGEPINEITLWASRLNTGVRRDIEIAVMLIDRSVLAEIDAFTLADYATMRLLAQTRPPSEDGEYGTILALVDADGLDTQAPVRLSAFDRAYLRSLYRGEGTRPSRNAHSSIDELMVEELVRE